MFDKIFGQCFKNYKYGVHKIISRSSINQTTYFEVEEELAEMNNLIIEQIITASGPFDPKADEKFHSNFSPSKSRRGGSPNPENHK